MGNQENGGNVEQNQDKINPLMQSLFSMVKIEKLPVDALNSLLEIALQKLSKYTDVSTLEEANKDLNENVYKFERGKNFQGVIDQDTKQLVGMCRVYFSSQLSLSDKKVFTVFFGNFQNKTRFGECIQAKSYITNNDYRAMKIQNKIALNLKQIQILKLDDWDSQQVQKGIFLSLNKKQTILYQGDFKDKHFLQGQLKVKNQDQLILKYQGKFNSNNQLHDKNGILQFIGKTKYIGQFKNNERSGYGVQDDYNKKTRYVGTFYKNKKNGYGQLTYLNRENIKLKAFWNDDMVKKEQGVFVTDIGQKLQLMGDNTYI